MGGNQTWNPELILVVFQLSTDMEIFVFCIFLLLFVSNMLANGLILGLTWLDDRLHTPIYFFHSHLSIIDIFYSSTTLLKMLENLVKHQKTISYVSCAAQLMMYGTFGTTECFILMVMSYDRYVAICHPLHYPVIMSWGLCKVMAITFWVCGISIALRNQILFLRLPYCESQEINFIFCEFMAPLKGSCVENFINKISIISSGTFIFVGPLSLMIVSYYRIGLAMLKIRSKQGHRKAFSTCSSDLCVVGFSHWHNDNVIPDSGHQDEQKKVLNLFYTLYNPLLNPLIYSPRNAQVKAAFNRALQKQETL